MPDDGVVPTVLPPKKLRELTKGLDEFKAAYLGFLEHGGDERRQEVHRTMPAAQRALNAAALNLVVADPPALGAHRQTYTGLATLTFLHEQPGWQYREFSVPQIVLDNLDGARGRLADMRKQQLRRRRNPLYWIDKALRALLTIPAYLVGLIVGESAVKIDRSAWGLPLRLFAIVADALGIYGAGRVFGWW